jgi:aminopeptidase
VDIRIGSPSNTHSLSTIDPGKIRTRGKANRDDWEFAGQRTAAGEHRWVASRYPTHALAQAAEMSLTAFEDFLYRATYADTEDPVARWQAFHDRQAILIDQLTGKSNVIVKGPEVDLTFSIENRCFKNSSGHHNMPDGEIYTGPVEDSVNGWVRFSYPVIYGGHEVVGAELHFENGRAVKATADKGEEFLNSMLDSDPGARYVGEFAIGTNWEIQKPTRNMLFDEKIGGTIHMAMGAGYPETGSVNNSAIHWDMLCDMRDGGQIFVDGELFYDSGEFIEQHVG